MQCDENSALQRNLAASTDSSSSVEEERQWGTCKAGVLSPNLWTYKQLRQQWEVCNVVGPSHEGWVTYVLESNILAESVSLLELPLWGFNWEHQLFQIHPQKFLVNEVGAGLSRSFVYISNTFLYCTFSPSSSFVSINTDWVVLNVFKVLYKRSLESFYFVKWTLYPLKNLLFLGSHSSTFDCFRYFKWDCSVIGQYHLISCPQVYSSGMWESSLSLSVWAILSSVYTFHSYFCGHLCCFFLLTCVNTGSVKCSCKYLSSLPSAALLASQKILSLV